MHLYQGQAGMRLSVQHECGIPLVLSKALRCTSSRTAHLSCILDYTSSLITAADAPGHSSPKSLHVPFLNATRGTPAIQARSWEITLNLRAVSGSLAPFWQSKPRLQRAPVPDAQSQSR